MTKLNNEIRELAIDELDEISGGWCRPGPGYPIGTAASYGIAVGQFDLRISQRDLCYTDSLFRGRVDVAAARMAAISWTGAVRL